MVQFFVLILNAVRSTQGRSRTGIVIFSSSAGESLSFGRVSFFDHLVYLRMVDQVFFFVESGIKRIRWPRRVSCAISVLFLNINYFIFKTIRAEKGDAMIPISLQGIICFVFTIDFASFQLIFYSYRFFAAVTLSELMY